MISELCLRRFAVRLICDAWHRQGCGGFRCCAHCRLADRETLLPNCKTKEADRYRTAGLNYAPRQAPFQNVAELHFVLGLPPNLLERALPFVTVFNGHAEIDVNEAAPEVIESLPHMTPDLAAAILKQRDPRNPQAVLQLASAASGVTSGGRRAIRATIHGTLEDGRKIKAEVVFLVADSSPNPYRILAWKDDLDGAS